MQRDPENSESSLRGNEAQRRQRKVHKLRMNEMQGLDGQEISAMVASGDIELMVRRSDLVEGSSGDWCRRIAELLEKVGDGLQGVPEHENRTIIVNIISSGAGHH